MNELSEYNMNQLIYTNCYLFYSVASYIFTLAIGQLF